MLMGSVTVPDPTRKMEMVKFVKFTTNANPPAIAGGRATASRGGGSTACSRRGCARPPDAADGPLQRVYRD